MNDNGDLLERRELTVRAEREVGQGSEPNSPATTGSAWGVGADTAFEVEEKWEGCVDEIYSNSFLATVENLNSGERASIRLPLRLIKADDRSRLAPGALFLWHLGYRDTRDGGVEEISTVTLRRIVGEPLIDQAVADFWMSA